MKNKFTNFVLCAFIAALTFGNLTAKADEPESCTYKAELSASEPGNYSAFLLLPGTNMIVSLNPSILSVSVPFNVQHNDDVFIMVMIMDGDWSKLSFTVYDPVGAVAASIGYFEYDNATCAVHVICSTPTPLAGVYTIDNSLPTGGANFNSFTSAIEALNERGISDAVTFEVVAGQVHEFTLSSANGLKISTSGTETMPIVFRKSGAGANPKLLVTGTVNTSDMCFNLTNVNYITFDGIDIENAVQTGSGSGVPTLECAFNLNNASNIEIRNCNINLYNENTSSAFYGIYISGTSHNNTIADCSIQLRNSSSNIAFYETGTGNNLYVENVTVKNAYYGFYFQYATGSGNTICKSNFDNVYHGITITSSEIYPQDNFTLKDNLFTNINYRCIHLGTGNNIRLINNVIHFQNTGAYAGLIGIEAAGGLRSGIMDTLYFVHNTIYISNQNTGQSTCLYFLSNANARYFIANNILVNKGTNSSTRVIYNANTNTSIIESSNNNIYYCPNGFIYYTNSTVNCATLVQYRNYLNGTCESYSYQLDVPFISTDEPFNFNISTTEPTKAESGGQVLDWVLSDIVGNPRQHNTVNYTGTGTAPDIGAYEFEGTPDETDLTPMNGVYTINNALETDNRNFQTFQEAIAALNSKGFIGNLFFDVPADQIFDITLTSATGLQLIISGKEGQVITFRKSGTGANPKLLVTGTTNTSDICFNLSNVNYITFNGIDIENAVQTGSGNNVLTLERAFSLNNASHIEIRNCNINLLNANNTPYFYGIYISGTSHNNTIADCSIQLRNNIRNYAFYETGSGNNLYVENVTITNAYYGFYFDNASSNGNTICKSNLDNVYQGIYQTDFVSYLHTNFTIKDNLFTNVTNRGIVLGPGNNKRCINNVIYCNNPNANFIGISTTDILRSGIMDTLYFVHNTIYIPDMNTGTSTCLAFSVENANARYFIANNILVNKGNNTATRVIYNANTLTSILEGSDNNIYYCPTGVVYTYRGSSNYKSLVQYRDMLGNGREAHSYYEDVPFMSVSSPFNFSIDPAVPTKAENGGHPLDWVLTDIAGNLRANHGNYTGTGTAPDIGAYEFEGIIDPTEYTPMSGVYTIDSDEATGARNYNTFTEAIDDLNRRGKTGSLIFEVAAGKTYNVSMTAPAVKALSIPVSGTEEYPLIFRKEGAGSNPKIAITGTSNTDVCFSLENVSYITFDGIDIENNGTAVANHLEQVFLLYNANNITIRNCNIKLRKDNNYYGINISGNTNRLTVENVLFTDTYSGVYVNNTVSNLIFENVAVKNATAGIYFYNNSSTNVLINNCIFDNITSAIIQSSNASSYRHNNFTVKGNRIINVTTGITLAYGNSQCIYNNVIHATTNGIYLNASLATDTVHLAYNTVYIYSSAGTSQCVQKSNGATKLSMINNIFINKSTGESARCFYNAGSVNDHILPVTNNNIYFCLNGIVYQLGSVTKCRIVSEYQLLFSNGTESNSMGTDVAFVNVGALDFHIKTDIPSKAESNAQPLSWILTDFEGNARHIETPDIGAYEFDGIIDETDIYPLSGVYTINPDLPTEARNFSSFDVAISALNIRGISNAVTFEILAEQEHYLALPTITGMQIITSGTETKPIIFQKTGTGANPVIKATATGYADQCFTINGANYITFDGIDIENAGNSSSNYLERPFILNSVGNITIRNCNIRLYNVGNSYGIGIIGNGNNRIIVENVLFTDVSVGIYVSAPINDLILENVAVRNATNGIYFFNNGSSCTNVLINNCTFDNISGTAISLPSCTSCIYNNFTVKGTQITNAKNGIALGHGNHQRIYNNIIHATTNGISLDAYLPTDTVHLAYNTVYIYGSVTTSQCVRKANTATKLNLINNIFINKSTGTTARCFYNESTVNDHILSTTNNNIYFCPNGITYQLGNGSVYGPVSAYKALFTNGTESNSMGTDVTFESVEAPLDFHIRTDIPSKAESAAQPLSWILTDLEGNTRHSATPDIGAYEFDGIIDETDISPLSGVYTINTLLPTGGRNFNSFEVAISTLNLRGISNAVTFDVIAEQVHNLVLPNIGMRIRALGTETAPIVFQKSGAGANPLIKATATSATTDVCFDITGVKYITFDGIDIENAGNAAANYLERAFNIISANNITIRNCKITLQNTNSSNYSAIRTDGAVNRLWIENVAINNAYYGIYLYSEPNVTANSNTICKSSFNNVNTGIIENSSDTYRQNNLTIKENIFTNAVNGITLGYGNNQRIYNNVIHATTNGIYLNASLPTDTVHLAYNTVYIYGTVSSSQCVLKSYSATKLSMINNIFINKSTGSNTRCFHNGSYTNEHILPTTNNNIYFCPNGITYQLGNGSVYGIVSAYKALFTNGTESNSMGTDVTFESVEAPLDFHIRTDIPSKAENTAQPLSWILTDFEGNARHIETPDIGAYEFDGIIDETDISPMNGIYTINTVLPTEGRNFNSFDAAITALNIRGISDAVTFEVVAGQVHNLALPNTGMRIKTSGTETAPVVFQKSGAGDNPLIKATATSSNDDACFTINGIDYITFDGIDIENAGTASSNNLERGFYLTAANNITIRNCKITLQNTSNNFAIRVENVVNRLWVENVTINNAYYGVHLNTNTSSTITTSNTICKSSFNNVNIGIYEYSFAGYRQNNLTIKENIFTNITGAGIDLAHGNNHRIINNVIYATNGIYIRTTTSTDTTLLAYNTVFLQSASTAYCVRKLNATGKIELCNNIFINKSANTNSYCFYNESNDAILPETNNNIYFKTSGGIYRSTIGNCSSLDLYRMQLGDSRESNSQVEEVAFVSTIAPFDFHIDLAVQTWAESGGKLLSWVSNDLEGNPRFGHPEYSGTGSAPDIGAYEFEGKDIFSQSVCSGEETEEVDFTQLYQVGSVSWTVTTPPANTTGYLTSGTDILPAMTLINSSTETDELIYTLTPATGTPMTYVIYIRPVSSLGTFDTNMFPADNAVLNTTTVTFSWQSVAGAAYYDLYVWNDGEESPLTPTISNIRTLSTNIANLTYGNTYHWKAVARTLCVELESTPRSFSLRALPDLHVTTVNVSTAYAGQTVTVSWTVKNDGEGATLEPVWNDRIYLTPFVQEGTAHSETKLLATVPNMQPLNAGENYSNSTTVTIPNTFAGTYYMLVTADMGSVTNIDWTPTGSTVPPVSYTPNISGIPYPYLFGYCSSIKAVVEVSRGNHVYDNFFYTQFDILPSPLPDLVVLNASFPANIFSGNSWTINYEVKNQGAAAAAGSWTDAFYITLEEEFNQNAVHLGNVTRSNQVLPVNGTYTATPTFTVPNFTMGDYNVFIVVNSTGSLYEGIFDVNNTYKSPVKLHITLTPPADLAPVSMTAPASANMKEQVSISFSVINQGANATTETFWKDRIYLSPTPEFNDLTAVALSDNLHSGILAVDQSYNVTTNVTIPKTIAGDCYFFVYTDVLNQVFEYDQKENNLYACTHATTILPPDIAIVDMEWITTPLIVGEPATISWTVKNVGLGRVINETITDKFYISTSEIFDPETAWLIDSLKYPISLDAEESVVKTTTLSIPCISSESYYIIATTDATQQLFENGETENNTFVMPAQDLLAPDLIITNLTVPVTGSSGQPVTINYTIQNDYNGAVTNKQVNTKFFISASLVLDVATATLMGEHNVTLTLAPDATEDLLTTLNLPNGIQGNFYIHAFVNANHAICEEDTNNNVTSKPIAITLSPSPDFVVTEITIPSGAVAGTDIIVDYTVQNIGNSSVTGGYWNDKIYISRETVLDNTATLLHTVNNTGDLDIDDTYTKSCNVTLPNTISGAYYILVFTDADNHYYEHETEDNNVTASNSIEVSVYPLDLAAMSFTVSATTLPWNASVNLSLQIKNISEKNTLYDTWYDAFYLSTTPTYSSSAQLLKEIRHIGHIAPDGTYSVTTSYTVPMLSPGTYYLIAAVDNRSLNPDINRSNNYMYKQIEIESVPLPDLRITNLTVLDPTLSGQQFRVAYTIINSGSGNITAKSWRDVVILSNDPDAPLSGDLQLQIKTRSMTLLSGASYKDTVTVTVPLPKQGNFVLWLKTDANNQITESNEYNNLFSRNITVTMPEAGDLEPYNINAEFTITSGEDIHVTYNIRNNAAAPVSGSNLRDLIYLSMEPEYNINSVLLGQVNGAINIPAFSSIARNFSTRISGLKEGDYYVIVKTDALNAYNETNKTNNTATSNYPVQVHLINLPVNTLVSGTLMNAYPIEYKLETTGITGETILVSLDSNDPTATNNLYATLNNVANNINCDYSSEGQFTATPNTYIPSTLPDYYGITVSGRRLSGDLQHVEILAEILPFEIRSITPNYGGNTGQVTVLIRGAKFTPTTTIWLEKSGSPEITPASIEFINNATIRATFNLASKPTGNYTVKARNGSDPDCELVNGFSIEAGVEQKLALNLSASSDAIRPNRPAKLTLEYGNAGNTDIINPILNLVCETHNVIALTQEALDLGENALILPLTTGTGMNNLLPPGFISTIDIFVNTLPNDMLFSIRHNLGHTTDGYAVAVNPGDMYWRDCRGVIPSTLTLNTEVQGGTVGNTFAWYRENMLLGNSSSIIAQTPGTYKIIASNGSLRATNECYFGVIKVLCSVDPNEIEGPEGYGEPQWIAQSDKLSYTIHYENDPEFATAPASRVKITYPVNNRQNINSFRMGDFGFGEFVFSVPANTVNYYKRLNLAESMGIWVDVTAGIDIVNRELFWILQTIDPATGVEPINANLGFLPVNDKETGNGEGYVSFTILPATTTVTGDEIIAEAVIVFDDNEEIGTNTWSNTVDAVAPQSSLTGTTLSSSAVQFSFETHDDPGGCGVKRVELYVSEDYGAYISRASVLPGETYNFNGTPGIHYDFFAIAEDHVGNKETMKSVAEYSFTASEVLTYTISASTITSFGSLQTPYTQPDAQTVTITNTGTGSVTLTQPTSTNYDIGTLSTTTLASTGATATFTVQPKAGLAVGTYNEIIYIYGSNSVEATVATSFEVLPVVINIAEIEGVTVPVAGEMPVTTITETAQYTGTVTWSPDDATFGYSTVYTATITITPKTGYTLTGVSEDFFTVAGTSAHATNDANSGVVTAVFPQTEAAPPTVINIAEIEGVTVPVAGQTPVTTITETAQYTGTVTWSPNDATFGYSTVYTATITITPKTGYTLTGVSEDFFTVAGTSAHATNDANSGVVTAVFPQTEAAPPTGTCPLSVTDNENNEYPVVRLAGICWTAANLKNSKYNDDAATPILFAKPYYSTLYPNLTQNKNNYGLLYDYASASAVSRSSQAPHLICPDGWRIPTSAEWVSLNMYFSDDLKNAGFWAQPNSNTNNTGLDIRGSGYYNSTLQTFERLTSYTAFWSSDVPYSTTCNAACLRYNCNEIEIVEIKLTDAVSVRCVLDE